MNIWQFNTRVSKLLLGWNLVNIAIGVLLANKSKFWKGFASQNIGWGVINIAIATGGYLMGKRRFSQLDDPYKIDILRKETRNLKRILIINSMLDLLYIYGGFRFSETTPKERQKGMGIGIMLQGALLFVFDITLIGNLPTIRNKDEEL